MIAHQPRAVPREGLCNPVFDGMGATEDLIVSMSFLPGLTDEQVRVVHRWLRSLSEPGGLGDPLVSPLAATEPFVHEHLFHARLGNLHDPRGAVQRLIDKLTVAGAQIQDSFYACWEWRPDGIMGPRPDPRAPTPATEISTMTDYLDRLWDPRLAPPNSEVDTDLVGGFVVLDQLVLEHRGSALYFPEARIGYGLAPFTLCPVDRRTSEVRRTVIASLAAGWRTLFKAPGKGHARPQPVSSTGIADQIDKIACGTRVGYLLSIEAVELMDRPSPQACRFREYELMEALLDAVAQLALAPVVTWQRFGIPTVLTPISQPETVEIQLWEVGGEHASHFDGKQSHRAGPSPRPSVNGRP